MLKIKYFIAIITGVSLFSSCVLNPDPLDIYIPEPEQEMVVSSFFVPPQGLAVTFTRTFSALLGEDSVDLEDNDVARLIFVDSAEVSLSYDGKTVQLYQLAPSVFGSAEAESVYNTEYTLRAKDFATGKSVTAKTVLLPPVDLDTVYPENTILPSFNDTIFTFKYEFRDVAGTENYYLATYTNFREFLSQVTNPASGIFNFNQTLFHVFTDKNNGDGEMIEYKPDFAGVKGDTIVVALSNITKEYYEFLSAYKRSGNLFSQLVGEPINLPTNVDGGYGYFALIRPRAKIVILR